MDTLRSVITPITHNLPGPIRDLGVSIIGDTCYKALLLDVDLENTVCLKLAISKALGIGIVGASSVVKVPQIIKLVQSQSASGVSFLSYLLETSSYLISLAYNVRNAFPFSTYGETALVLGQNVIITVLVLNYSGRASMAALFVAALATCVVTLFSQSILDMQQLRYLQAGAGVLSVASKIPQILAIVQEGGTGQLSAYTVSSGHSTDRPWNASLMHAFFAGVQLPPRLAHAHLHDPARGGRQAHPVRVHRWVRPQRGPGAADGLLLERAVGQGEGQAQGGPRPSVVVRYDDINTQEQGSDDSPPRLSNVRNLWIPASVFAAPAAGLILFEY
jgi:mannose-P-dolichol utilization defect protein 1